MTSREEAIREAAKKICDNYFGEHHAGQLRLAFTLGAEHADKNPSPAVLKLVKECQELANLPILNKIRITDNLGNVTIVNEFTSLEQALAEFKRGLE